MDFNQVSVKIEDMNEPQMEAARKRQESLIKPLGSLGVLENISIQMAGITGKTENNLNKKILFLFGADNGVYDEGISAAPQHFTNVLINAYGRGTKCGINVICNKNNVDLKVVDMGVKGDIDYENIINKKLMLNGTDNFSKQLSMSKKTAIEAVEIGFEFAKYAYEKNYDIIGTGEVGMGNTTSAAACIMAALGTDDSDNLVGRGGGLTDEDYENKKKVIKTALKFHEPDSNDIFDILSKVGGLDIAAMTGLFIGAAYFRVPIVIDGVISIAAALLAYKFNPLTKKFMFPSHVSQEPAYKAAAIYLEIDAILNLHMRLGEGTGCPIAMGVIENALAIYNEMSTFEEMMMEKSYREKLIND